MSRRKKPASALTEGLIDALEDAVEDLVEGVDDLTDEFLRPFLRPGPRRARSRGTTVAKVLAELELPRSDEPVIHAVIARRPVALSTSTVSGSRFLWARCELAAPLPADAVVVDRRTVQGGRPLKIKAEQAVMIGTSNPDELAAVLSPRDVQAGLLQLGEAGCRIRLEKRQVLAGIPLGMKAWRVADEVRRVAALANSLDTHALWRWRGLAEELRLSFEATPPNFSGKTRGVALSVRYVVADGSTQIRAAIDGLPARTAVAARSPGERSVDLNDPILDRLLRVRTADPGALANRLCRDAVRGPLLEVLMDHPGSTLEQGRITLVAPGLLQSALRAKVALVVELAAALQSSDGGLA